MKITIKNRFTDEIMHEGEYDSLRDMISSLVSKGKSLSGANLSGADLSDAYLSGANLSRANLSGAYMWIGGVKYLLVKTGE